MKHKQKENREQKGSSLAIPCATVFLSSACIMIIEIVAGRLVAKYLGATLYVWTSVISVVLGGITIGNYIGGRLADTYPAKKLLPILFGASSVACVIIIILNNITGEWPLLIQLPWPVRVLLHVAIIFLVPSAVLGTISPVVAKTAFDSADKKGSAIGKVYAFGAAGSIFGTILAGFILISLLGTAAIIWIIAGILLAAGILYGIRFWPLYAWAFFLIVLFFLGGTDIGFARAAGAAIRVREQENKNIMYEDESDYCYIAIEQLKKNPDIRQFVQDDLKSHSQIIMDDPQNLQFMYTKIFAGITHMAAGEKKTVSSLAIGGGGYVFPRYLEHNFPGSNIEVVEIDPAVTLAAVKAFGLEPDTTIRTSNTDARDFVNRLIEKKKSGGNIGLYDFIYGDAFGSSFIPYQLTTREFHESLKQLLTPDGMYISNLPDLYTSAKFIGAVINTMKQVFPYVAVVTVFEHAIVGSNYIVAGSMKKIDMEAIRATAPCSDLDLWIFNDADMSYVIRQANSIILTDEYAPVEQLLSPFVFMRSKYLYARQFLDAGDKLQQEGKWRKSIEQYELAMKHCPELTIVGYTKIGQAYAELKIWSETADACIKAITYNDKQPVKVNLAEITYDTGVFLLLDGKESKALDYMRKAVQDYKAELERKPGTALTYTNLGNAYAYLGDFDNAYPCFIKAVELSPADAQARITLVTALMIMKKYDEAKQQLREGIDIAVREGNEDNENNLKEFLNRFDEKKKELAR